MISTHGTHPHFNDRGAVRWYTSLAEVSLRRTPETRRCSLSTVVLLEARVAPWSRAPFPRRRSRPDSTSRSWRWLLICDQPDPEVQELWTLHMSSARSLPFVFYTDADEQFLHGTSGSRSVADWFISSCLMRSCPSWGGLPSWPDSGYSCSPLEGKRSISFRLER